MNLPAELRYTKDHEWVRVENDGAIVTIGITDYAQGELGDIVFVELDPVGEDIDREASFGSVEAVKAVSDLFMPVSGTIMEHNGALEEDPSLVNSDAYGRGWMIRVRMRRPEELGALLSAEEYAGMVA